MTLSSRTFTIATSIINGPFDYFKLNFEKIRNQKRNKRNHFCIVWFLSVGCGFVHFRYLYIGIWIKFQKSLLYAWRRYIAIVKRIFSLNFMNNVSIITNSKLKWIFIYTVNFKVYYILYVQKHNHQRVEYRLYRINLTLYSFCTVLTCAWKHQYVGHFFRVIKKVLLIMRIESFSLTVGFFERLPDFWTNIFLNIWTLSNPLYVLIYWTDGTSQNTRYTSNTKTHKCTLNMYTLNMYMNLVYPYTVYKPPNIVVVILTHERKLYFALQKI